MLPKNKKLRREREKIQNEFSQEVESDDNSSIPVNRPIKLDDDMLPFDFENDDHRPLDEGCNIY
jgi:hypothetical protein